jgi:aldehyde:ferredoxin oxidoreductase
MYRAPCSIASRPSASECGLSELYGAVLDELRTTAARIVTAKKRFNIAAGWTPADDTLPERILNETLPEDARAKLSPERLATLVQAYNTARGWTPEGYILNQCD